MMMGMMMVKDLSRNYDKEKEQHKTPAARKANLQRKEARRVLEKAGRVHKGDGKEVDHKRPLSKGGSNAKSNLRVVSRTVNRSKQPKRK